MTVRGAAVVGLFIGLAPFVGLGQEEPSGPKDLSSIVHHCLKAYGGLERLERVVAVRQSGHAESPLHGRGLFHRIVVPPDRLKAEVTFEDGWNESRLLDGGRGWRQGTEVTGPPLEAMVLQSSRLRLPMLLWERREELQDRGELEKDGEVRRVVEIPLGQDAHLRVELASDGRILRTEGQSGPLAFVTEYGGHRHFEGVLFATVEDTWVMGRKTGHLEFDQILLLDEVPEEELVPGPPPSDPAQKQRVSTEIPTGASEPA